ncbi:MAG: aminoacyl-histidine dipeptidase [Defluviitaleaceae bacterium]|nr:aminoacyl-histidine dipeptidase [Defluviitaleaceae bacterium]
MNVLNIEPKEVFKYFAQISNIPRGSNHEKEISDYLVKFAKDRELYVIQDKYLNVIIEKKSSEGYEDSDTVILQSHMDMVNEKNADYNHNFLKDPLKLYVDGDFLSAEGTTLGADNGIAVAMTLAILDGNYEHPKIQALFTTNEETGMSGAENVDINLFKDSKYLINLDSDREGEFTVSCAGGIRHSVQVELEYLNEKEIAMLNFSTFKITVNGLVGGHSGIDIDKGFGNAIQLLTRILHNIMSKDLVYLSNISGGLKVNAIPREATAIVSVEPNFEKYFLQLVKEMTNNLKKEYRETEENLNIEIEKIDTPVQVFSFHSTMYVIHTLFMMPNGLYKKNKNGDIITSTNIGVVFNNQRDGLKDVIDIESLTRSSIKSEQDFLVEQIKCIADMYSIDYINHGENPVWEYNENSKLREICVDVYKKVYGTEPKISATHGGLECGIFSKKMPHLDIISFGPNNYYLHTPDEKLSISSTERVYKYLLEVLKNLK